MRSLLVLAALATAAPAFAQRTAARTAQPATPAPPVQRLDGFDDEEIGGNLLHPDGEAVTGARRPPHPSLVRARTTFVPELVRSALDR
jgi:hypothetical protein